MRGPRKRTDERARGFKPSVLGKRDGRAQPGAQALALSERDRSVIAEIRRRARSESTFNKKTECFTIQEDNGKGGTRTVRLRGLVPALKELFYPTYRFTGRTGGKEKAPVVGASGASSKGKGTSRAGIDRGHRVDVEVQRCIQSGTMRPECRATRHVLSAMLKMGLKPVLAQVPVHGASIGLRVGTAVDVVCLDANSRPHIIEVKTGYANYYDAACGKLKGVLSHVDSAPRSHHQMQLLMTCDLFEQTTRIKPAGAMVLRVIASGVQYIKLDATIRSKLDGIRSTLKGKYRV